MGSIVGLMGDTLKVSGNRGNNMERVSMLARMELCSMGLGKKVKDPKLLRNQINDLLLFLKYNLI